MILDDHHAPDRGLSSTAERDARRQPTEQAIPLAEFDWSDSVIGMGYLPHELALPTDWRWGASR